MNTTVKAGIFAGLIGGVAFGGLMAMMGMLPMVAKLIGSSSALAGFGVHMVISAAIGFLYAIIFGAWVKTHAQSIPLGLLYGVAWWFLGPLIIMPLLLGMGVQLTLTGIEAAMPSLIGHLVYGFFLGAAYPVLANHKIATAKINEQPSQ